MGSATLPAVAAYFDASQEQLNLFAVAYPLGLACSVLWMGALGDRYGRKQIAILGLTLTMLAALICAFAPRIEVLIFGRLFGGFAAGMSYPTTLALIAALWAPGPARTRSIALWTALGGAIGASGPLLTGLLLTWFTWHVVFLAILPVAVAALFMAMRNLPSHVNEETEPVDNVGGVLSLVLVGSLILSINLLPVERMRTLAIVLLAIAVGTLVFFIRRQRHAENPLFDLKIAARAPFWVAAVAGIVVFGSLIGATFIGQQFLHNVLGYSVVEAGLAVLPVGILMLLVAPRSPILIEARGARFTLLAGHLFIMLGFLSMLLLWRESSPYWEVALGYSFIGIGVGLAGPAASRSLTASVPVRRAGMASSTADLQRDLGGAIMQSIFGVFLATGYASAMAAWLAGQPKADHAAASVTNSFEMSYAGARTMAVQYPQYASQIMAAAKASFLAGDRYAYIAGILAVMLGSGLVYFMFPKLDQERKLLGEYRTQDLAEMATRQAPVVQAAAPQPAVSGEP
jgi:MFS family permease